MIEAIAKRKSIRSFADRKIEHEKVESLLRAQAGWASDPVLPDRPLWRSSWACPRM